MTLLSITEYIEPAPTTTTTTIIVTPNVTVPDDNTIVPVPNVTIPVEQPIISNSTKSLEASIESLSDGGLITIKFDPTLDFDSLTNKNITSYEESLSI